MKRTAVLIELIIVATVSGLILLPVVHELGHYIIGVSMESEVNYIKLDLYLPYGWLVMIDYPWGSYRWHLVASWPGLPLRLVLHPLINRWSATVECIVATITTIPLVCVLVYLGSRGRKALVSVSMVALLLSLVNL